MSKKTRPEIAKDDFIAFLAEASPEEVSRLIAEKGKPRKLVEPMIFFGDKQDDKSKDFSDN